MRTGTRSFLCRCSILLLHLFGLALSNGNCHCKNWQGGNGPGCNALNCCNPAGNWQDCSAKKDSSSCNNRKNIFLQTFCTWHWCTGGEVRRRRAEFCSECWPGYYGSSVQDEDCLACVGGETRRRRSEVCTDCPPGKFTAAPLTRETGLDDCIACDGSVRRRRADQCTDCASGSFKEDINSDDCALCYGSVRRRRAQSCTDCRAGWYREDNLGDDCVECIGSARRRRSETCDPCPAGSHVPYSDTCATTNQSTTTSNQTLTFNQTTMPKISLAIANTTPANATTRTFTTMPATINITARITTRNNTIAAFKANGTTSAGSSVLTITNTSPIIALAGNTSHTWHTTTNSTVTTTFFFHANSTTTNTTTSVVKGILVSTTNISFNTTPLALTTMLPYGVNTTSNTTTMTSTTSTSTTTTSTSNTSTTRTRLTTRSILTARKCSGSLYAVDGQRNFTLLDTFIRIGAAVGNCGVWNHAPSVNWSWSQTYPTKSSTWTELPGDSLNLRIAATLLNGVGSYDIRCVAPKLAQVIFFKVFINGYPKPIVSLVAPGIASPQCDFVLDASGSEDPSGAGLSFSWACEPFSKCNLTDASSPSLRISAGRLDQGEYRFTVVVSRGGVHAASSSAVATVMVQTGANNRPSVSLGDPAAKVSAQVPMRITAISASSLDCPVPAWRVWWLVQANESHAWNLSLAREVIPLDLILRSLIAPSGDYFLPGRYFLRLVLSSSSDSINSWNIFEDGVFFYDTEQFFINAGPKGGILGITPSHGTPITTSFQISANGWIDEDVPLTYQFFQHLPSPDGQIDLLPLTDFQLANNVERLFGMVGNVTMQGDVKDSLGSVSSAFGMLLIEANQTIRDLDMLRVLAASLSFGDVLSSVNTISAIATHKAGNKSLAGNLLDAIESTGALEDPSPGIIQGVASTLQVIVAPGEQEAGSEPLDVGLASRAVDIASSLVQAAQTLESGLHQTAAMSIIGAGSSILGILAHSDPGKSSTEADVVVKKALAPKLIKLMAADLPDAMLLGMRSGDTTIMERAGTSVTIAKLSSVRNDSIRVGSITIASLDSLLGTEHARRLDSCSAHGLSNAKWATNPYSYAGNTTTNNESNSTINGTSDSNSVVVTDCCAVQDNSVVSIEVRACGKELIVQNLSTPIEFDVYAEGINNTNVITYDPNLEYDELNITSEDLRSCQYWNTHSDTWSTEGCRVIAKHATRIRCACTHLSSFGGALGKKFGKFGNSNAALLMKPPKINFARKPFQVALLWFALLYLPCFACCYLDRKDYKWLSQRTELFKDKIPRHSGNDCMCMLFPGFRLLGGFIAFTPTFINCSKCKRRAKWCLFGGCCKACLKRGRLTSKRFGKGLREDMTSLRALASSMTGASHEPYDQNVPSKFVGSFGPEVRMEGAEPSLNQLLCHTTDPPLRKHVSMVCAYAQEEISMASDQSGVDHKLTDIKNRAAYEHSVCSVRRFNWKRTPVTIHEKLRKHDLESQIMTVKVCHLLVEDWSAREKEADTLSATNKCSLSNFLNKTLYRQFLQGADKKREILQENLVGLLRQHPTYSVAYSPPPLHAIRIEVVALSGLLPAMEENGNHPWRNLGEVDAIVEPGQHFLMWTCCTSGELLIHEASINFCDVWNLEGMKHSIVVPLANAADTKVEVSQVNAEQVQIEHQHGKGHPNHQEFLWTLHLPLISGGILTVRSVDHTCDKGVNSLQRWVFNTFDGGFISPMPELVNPYRGTTVQFSNEIEGYTARPRFTRRKLWDVKHPLAHKDVNTHRLGLIITKVEENSQAAELGLEAGMELLYVRDTLVKYMEFLQIINLLASFEGTFEVIFSDCIEANVIVTVRSQDVTRRKPPFHNQGMILEHRNRNHGLEDSLGDWHGFRENDEIITINDEPCYHCLGDSKAASRQIAHCWAYLRKVKHAELSFGVHRPSGGEPPPELQNFLSSPSIFRYARGASIPHTSSSQLQFSVDGTEYFPGMAWISHCGFVLSIHILVDEGVCIGIYLEDIYALKPVEEVHAQVVDEDVSIHLSDEYGECPLDRLKIANDAQTGATQEFQSKLEDRKIPTRITCYRIVLNAHRTSSNIDQPPNETTTELHIESVSEFRLRTIEHTIMSLKKAMVIAKATNFEHVSNGAVGNGGEKSLQASGDATASTHAPGDATMSMHFSLSSEPLGKKISRQAFGDAFLNFDSSSESVCKKMSRQASVDAFLKHSLTNESQFDDSVKKYWATYDRYLEIFAQERNDRVVKHAASVPPRQVASAMAYQAWPTSKIAYRSLKREQVWPRLLKHIAPVTRTERWGILCSGLNTAFFFMTLLFSPKCSHIPKAATCSKKKGKNFFEKHMEPSWDVVAATIFGLCLALPVPLFLGICFKKRPVLEQMTPEEKWHRILQWRSWQVIGWSVLVFLNLFYVYWFTVFTNEFPEGVLEKVANCAIISLFNKFFFVPVIRGSVFGSILVVSKFGPCCDVLILLCPQILLREQLLSFDPGQIDFVTDGQYDGDEDDGGLVDFDGGD